MTDNEARAALAARWEDIAPAPLPSVAWGKSGAPLPSIAWPRG